MEKKRGTVRIAAAVCSFCMMFGTVAMLPQMNSVSVLTSAADAEEYTEGTLDVLTYWKYADHIAVTKCDPKAKSAEVPAEIEGLPVTVIYEDAFKECAAATVTLPDTIEKIGRFSFLQCPNLKEIDIPASVKEIGSGAFRECSALEKVTLHEGLEAINSSAFIKTALTDITIPSTVTHFGTEIFDDTPWYTALVEKEPLVIFNHIVADGRYCEGDVVIPDTVTAISAYAFMGTPTVPSRITSIYVPDSVQEIGMDAFSDCTELISIRLPDHIEELPIGLLSGCCSLKSFTIPANCKSIRSGAFSLCTSLEEIVFPEHQVDIYSEVFRETKWLAGRRAENPLVIVNGTLIDGQTAKGDIVIPDDVTIISARAFSWNSDITSVVIPAGVTDIWDGSFEWCQNLESAEIKGASYIGPDAFGSCTKLQSLKLSGSLQTVGDNAFYGISGRIPLTFYGTKEQWQAITVGEGNTLLKIADIIYVIAGDVDGDNGLTVVDAVALQKWLLAVPDAKLKNPDASDLNGDGVTDIYDLALVKRALLARTTD